MKNIKLSIILLLLLAAPFSVLAQTLVDSDFNPNKIIEDSELLDYDSLNLSEIQSFLESRSSYLANYQTLNAHGTMKSAAEIIYDASHNNFDCKYNCDGVALSSNPTDTEKKLKCQAVVLSDNPTEAEKQEKCGHITTVSPKFLLILLQKEASLIENSSWNTYTNEQKQKRLDQATGYGCPDGWVCNPYYKGFGKQVNSASLQFLAYINEPEHYTYQAGQTYTIKNTLDPYCTTENQIMSVTPANKATAALYDYTPHVFNGNYNVHKLWERYFPKTAKLYPDSSILQVKGDPGIWLIENSKKRPFLNYSAFISRFKPSQIIFVTENDLNAYAPGEAIKFANYSLIQTPDKKIYLIVDKEKRPFESLAVFQKIGFNPAEIETATVADLVIYSVGKTITTTSTYVTGALLQDTKTGGIYYVIDGTKAPLTDKILLTTRFSGKKIIKATPAELEKYTKVAPVLLDDGTLVKTSSYPIVYLISNGQKRPFASGEIFTSLGYNFSNIITVSSQFLYNYSQGEMIQKIETAVE